MARPDGPRDGWGLERERKWLGDSSRAPLAVGLAEAWALPDATHPEGELESVYFESPGLRSWREKANGDALKRKVRIRWYRETSGCGPRRAWLEAKYRIGSAREKTRFEFVADGVFLDEAPLEDTGWTSLLMRSAADAEWGWMPQDIAAAVSIRYRRRRYRCSATGARLSVDFDIACTRANARLVPFAGPMGCPHAVFEAKSATADWWPFGPELARLGFWASSFSKYGYFMTRLVNGGYR